MNRNQSTLRLATPQDEPALETLIHSSTVALLHTHYTAEQIRHSHGAIFAVPAKLIEDGTLYVAVADGGIVGCGGWSQPPANPLKIARIHAFFVAPGQERRGIGKALLAACEAAIRTNKGTSVMMFSTLNAAPFYRTQGYAETGSAELPLTDTLDFPVIVMRKHFTP